jgi:hypothetical protein
LHDGNSGTSKQDARYVSLPTIRSAELKEATASATRNVSTPVHRGLIERRHQDCTMSDEEPAGLDQHQADSAADCPRSADAASKSIGLRNAL